MYPNHCVFLLHTLLYIATSRDFVEAKVLKSLDLDFNRHSVVRPVVHRRENKRELLSTRDGSGAHHAQVQVTVPIGNKSYILDLHLNEHLVTAGHTLLYQQEGSTVRRTPTREELDMCYYSGSVRGKPGSWVAVSTCHGLSGAIFDGRTMWYIEPSQGTEIYSSHHIYSHKDLNNDYNFGSSENIRGAVMYHPKLFNGSHNWKAIMKSRVSRYKRQVEHRVREVYGANEKSRSPEPRPERLFGSPTCGNGFIEEGEECDCGVGNEVPCIACCHPDTCRLRGNATCGGGACCDLTTCRLKSAGEVCRAKNGVCDLAEFCSGQSQFCPTDVYRMDSTPCGERDSMAFCVRGTCRSHAAQCRLLWGETAKPAHDKCYSLNTRGARNGNCGYNKINETFTPCAIDDALCGMLHCRLSGVQLEFGMESASNTSAMFINGNGTIIPCYTAIIDLGLNDVDPGLVPDGAKCGPEHMCLRQRCVPLESVRAAIRNGESSVCPFTCSGHGTCNSKGHCHCDQGFAPPLCVEPGPGGSVDSGPVTDLVRRSQIITD